MTELSMDIHITDSYAQALERVTEELKKEGFGVLTRIDVDKTLKEKIGVDFRPYTILGACNPQLAHRALTARADVGILLPCNVTVEQAEDGGSLVRVVNPIGMLSTGDLGDDPTLRAVGAEADERLRRVVTALAS